MESDIAIWVSIHTPHEVHNKEQNEKIDPLHQQLTNILLHELVIS